MAWPQAGRLSAKAGKFYSTLTLTADGFPAAQHEAAMPLQRQRPAGETGRGDTNQHPDPHFTLAQTIGKLAALTQNSYQGVGTATAITVDPSKGLSRLQRQILGTAYTMHVYGAHVAGGQPDYVTPLGIFAIFKIAPDLAGSNARFTRTPQVSSAQAALSRAATHLVERKLLAWRDYPNRCAGTCGFVLTDAGRRVGAREPVPVPQIERCARYFGMVRLSRWHRDGSGSWIATPWEGGEGGGYSYELVLEDCAAIASAIGGAA